MVPAPTATSGPPSSSLPTRSPMDASTTGGPAVKMAASGVMIERSHSRAVTAPCPAEGPITPQTMGTSPDKAACAWRSLGPPPPGSPGMGGRCPAPSSSMINGMRSRPAISAIRQRLRVAAGPIEPPMVVKSSAPTATGRPSIVPTPATRASAGTGPARVPISVNEPSSSRVEIRCRASRRPSAARRASFSESPIARACFCRRSKSPRVASQPVASLTAPTVAIPHRTGSQTPPIGAKTLPIPRGPSTNPTTGSQTPPIGARTLPIPGRTSWWTSAEP